MKQRETDGRKRIVPAVASLDRAAVTAQRDRPLRALLEGGHGAIGALREEIAEVAVQLRLTGLSQEEQGLFAGEAYDRQELLEQSIEGPLEQSKEVQEGAGAQPAEGRQLREALDEVGRAREAAVSLESGARDGGRLVGGLIAYACLRLCEHIEKGLREGGDRDELLADTARLRARVRDYLSIRAEARDAGSSEVARLEQAAESAETALRTEETLEALHQGRRPTDEAILSAAEHLRPATPAPPATPTDRRRGGR